MINPINESSITKDENIFENVQFLNEEVFYRYKKKKDIPDAFQKEALKIVELFEKELDVTKLKGGTRLKSFFNCGNAKKTIEKKKKKAYIFNIKAKDMDNDNDDHKAIISTFMKTNHSVQAFFGSVMKKSGFKLVDEKYSAIAFVKELDGYMIGVELRANNVLAGAYTNFFEPVTVGIYCLESEGKKGEKNKRTLVNKLGKY